MIVNHSAKRAWGLKSLLRFVRVVQVPDVGLLGHVGRHLLEPQLGVRSADAHLGGRLRVPGDLCNGAFDVVRVLEDHNSLCVDVLREVLWLFTLEVFLEQVDFVVLLDAFFGILNQILSSEGIAEVDFSQHFLLVFSDVEGLGIIEFLWPAYLAEYVSKGISYLQLSASCRGC